MIRHRVLVLAALAFALATPSAHAGQAGFAFLEVPVGARAAGMGGAYSAVARGVDAMFWNPAGLATFQRTELSASHVESYEQLRHDQFGVAGRMFGGGLAGSFRAMYSEPIEERDALGNLIGTFGAHDLEFQVGYGHALGGGASMGLAAQVVRERLADLGATTWSVSGGMAWDVHAISGARLAVGIDHLGPAAHFLIDGSNGAPVPLPTSVHAGASLARVVGHGLNTIGAIETRVTRGRQALVAVGFELDTAAGAALRAGLRAGDDVSRFSLGAGWHTGPLRVDYAFTPSRLDLDDTHRFTLGSSF